MKLSEIVQNFMFSGCQISGRRVPKFLTEFRKPGSLSNVAKFGDDQPSDLGDQVAKKEINYSSKTEWPAASIAGGRS